MNRITARRTALAALVAGTLTLAACGDDTDAGHGSMSNGATSASTSSGASAAAEDAYNDADVTFAAGMIPHHESAIEMAGLAVGRAADTRVLDLAGRIEDAQGPEIETLTGWLQQWGTDDAGGMAHRSMGHGKDGGMTGKDMAALEGAFGAEFDRLFLTQMVVHHRGAAQMAEAELAGGRSSDAITLAGTIRDSQAAEIAEMEQLLAELGG
jgi:uncharacterized protein (DUF305 family)